MVDKIRTLLNDIDDYQLNREIEQAEAAKIQLDEALALSEKAAKLDGLRQQKKQIESIRTAESTLSAVTRQTEDRLAHIEAVVSEWRDQFSRASYEIEQLIAEFVPLQKEIMSCGYALRKASENSYYQYHPERLPMGSGDPEADGSGIPGVFAASSEFETLWSQIGGMSSGLDVFGKLEGVSALLKALIVESSKVNPYLPSKGPKFFRRR